MAPWLEGERGQPGPLGPLRRRSHDADDGDEDHQRERRRAEVALVAVGPALDEEQDGEDRGDHDPDRDEQPTTRTGVDHLAQLDLGEPCERDPARRGGRPRSSASGRGMPRGHPCAEQRPLSRSSVSVVVMPPPPLARCWRSARGRCPRGRGRPPGRSSMRTTACRAAAARRRRGSASTCRPPPVAGLAGQSLRAQRPLQHRVVDGPHEGALALQAVPPWCRATIRPRPMTTISSATRSISLSRCEERNTVRPRRRTRAAGRASTGSLPGRGRSPARRGPAPRGRPAARGRGRAADASRASSCAPVGGSRAR